MPFSLVKSMRRHTAVGLTTGAILCSLNLRSGSAATRVTGIPPLKIALSPRRIVGPVDPARLANEDQGMLARNLFGRLFEYNEDGELVPGLVDTFEWRGRTLVLTITGKVKSSGGEPIGAEEAAQSLKRAVILNLRRHPEFNLFCADTPPRTLAAECHGLEVDRTELRLTPRPGVAGARLAHALASTQFSVVPRRDYIGRADLTMTTDLESSGAYRRIPGAGLSTVRLRANPGHYAIASDMPQDIELIPLPPDRIAHALYRGDVDVIPPSADIGDRAARELLKQFARFVSIEVNSPLATESRRAIGTRRWALFYTPESAHLELWKVRASL